MSGPQVFTTGEVAKFCNVRKMTVVRWVNRGELLAHQLPGRGDRRITRDDLLEFMERNGFPLPDELSDDGVEILVVDDDPHAANAIRRTLVGAGYQTEVATDGFRAGSMIETRKPRLITLDLSMPGMSGFEVLQYIREREDLNAMKVIVISGLPEKRMQEALAAGADEALSKPYKNEALVSAANALIGRPRRRKG